MTRVLIVDDSHFARSSLRRMLEKNGLVVAGEARDGGEALRMNAELRPDIICMDLVMEGMDGYEATRRIMQEQPARILVVSSLTETGARATFRALAAGALDFVKKPDGANISEIEKELLAKIRALASSKHPERAVERPAEARPAASPAAAPRPPLGGFRIVVIGSSTGGPAALTRVLQELPANFRLPILVAQHIPPGWGEHLAQHLAERCAIPVSQAKPMETVEQGHIYIAPGDLNIEITSARRIRLTGAATAAMVRPSADLLFQSAAELYGEQILGVILTGMGADGTEGARRIREARGCVITQTQDSCIVYGMPRSAVEAGHSAWQGSPEEIGRYIAGLKCRTADAAANAAA